MSRTRPGPDNQLDASLRRMRSALAQNRNQYAAMVDEIMAATGADVAERVTTKIADRHQRWLDRHQRRQQRVRGHRRAGGGDVPTGVVSAAAAAVCLVLAVLHPGLWWLVFVAVGFGSSAAKAFGRASRYGRAEREAQADVSDATGAAEPTPAGVGAPEPAAAAEPADPRVVRIQTLCDKLLAELESGPPIVRDVVTEPKATIGGLRQACIEIARRERELRSVLAAQGEGALAAERDALAARLSAERDEIVRDRLGQALRALEEQMAHRAELTTAATRLEAENTRILYTLESLHMQLLRARSTDMGAPELGGKLRESFRELGTQIDAVAEALEWASAPAEKDTADERRASAQRAAGARQAERR